MKKYLQKQNISNINEFIKKYNNLLVPNIHNILKGVVCSTNQKSVIFKGGATA